jgi:hypothetical protein
MLNIRVMMQNIINTLDIFVGWIPRCAHAMVLEWASMHKKELMNNWEKARIPSEIENIEPLE